MVTIGVELRACQLSDPFIFCAPGQNIARCDILAILVFDE